MRITRTEWHDWYLDGSESAVFADGKVTVLSELATTLLALVGDGVDLLDLTDGLTAAFGAPEGDSADVTRHRVMELVESGVLSVDEGSELG